MSLFGHILPGAGPGQGADAISLLGVESLAHKGGIGQAPCHAPLSKSATARALVNGFGISNHCNVDLILRRKSHPEPSSMEGFAGALPSSRRGRDLPEVIRQTSIEHTVQRRHCSPSPDRQTTASGNMVMRLASCARDARDCGRGIKGTTQRQFRSLSPPGRSRVTSPRSCVHRSYSQAALLDPALMADVVCATENGSPWRDDVDLHLKHRTKQSDRFHSLVFEPTSALTEVPPLQMANLEKHDLSPDSNASTRMPSRCSTLSNFTDHSALLTECGSQMNSDVGDYPETEMLTFFAKSASKRQLRAYERQLKAMVKDAQKKALKKAA